jgi:hypothetical protein
MLGGPSETAGRLIPRERDSDFRSSLFAFRFPGGLMTWTTDMATDAADHVEAFGRSISYTKRALGAMNTTTGKRAATETSTTLSGVVSLETTEAEFSGTAPRRVFMRTVSITAADLAAASITPDANDTITVSATVYRIEKINHRMDGALVVLTCKRTAP